MASKNVIAKGTTYNGVESITLPTSPSGTATFYEISDTTAVASDVASGKYFFASDGTYTQGSASGGGGSSWTKLTTATFTVSTTSTSNVTVGTISAGPSAYTSDKIVVVLVKDKAGPRTDHFLSSQTWFTNPYPANGSSTTLSVRGINVQFVTDNDKYGTTASAYGIFANRIFSSGDIEIYARYSSTSHIIDGEYQCDVYLLDWPDGTPFIPLT